MIHTTPVHYHPIELWTLPHHPNKVGMQYDLTFFFF
jgi:hypothetical protein